MTREKAIAKAEKVLGRTLRDYERLGHKLVIKFMLEGTA